MIKKKRDNLYTPEKMKKLDTFPNNKISIIILNILRFIILLEENSELEAHFFESVICYFSEFSKK